MVTRQTATLVLGVLCLCLANVAGKNAPLILVPGLAGSVLEARLNRTTAPAWYCARKTDDFRVLWLSLTEASRPVCLLDEMAVFFNATTGRYSNQTGVEVRPLDWGGLGGLEALDPGLPRLTPLYSALAGALKGEGFVEREDLYGAPYDFRLAGDGLDQVGFSSNFTALVEHAVAAAEGRRATVVAHSLGCLVSLYVLGSQAPEWLDKHIGALVAISAPWEGSVTALKGSISGDNFDVSVIPQGLLRPVQSTAPSGPWLFPAPDLWGDKVIVGTGTRNYTAGDAPQLLDDLGLEQQAAVYPRVHALTYPLPTAAFDVRCLYGTGLDTDEGYVYDVERFTSEAPPAPKHVRKGLGDGTVNAHSLEACKRLGDRAAVKTFKDGSHTGLLSDKRLIREVIRIATREQKSVPWTDVGREVRWAWQDMRDLLWAGKGGKSGESLRQSPW